MYSKDELQDGLQTHLFGRQLHIFDSIDSTNSYAKKLASNGAEEGTVCITEHQSAGRGRLGRSWEDEYGNNLLLSMILRPNLDPVSVGLLPFFASAGAALVIETVSGLPSECKWPNDVLISGKKCCGILLESVFQGNQLDYAVMGIGINVNQIGFSRDLAEKATSLRRECAREFDRRDLFRILLTTYETFYHDVHLGNFQSIINHWKKRAAMLGKEITVIQSGEIVSGRALDLAEDGALIVETSRGRRLFYAGDVTLTNHHDIISSTMRDHHVPRN